MKQRIFRDMRALADPALAEFMKRFMRTGKGEYAEGDRFLGIKVPETRKVAERYSATIDLDTAAAVVRESPYNEERTLGLVLMTDLFERRTATAADRQAVFAAYMELAAANRINNWNLVDVSAPQIVGGTYLEKRTAAGRRPLRALAGHQSLWMRRIGVVGTLGLIRKGEIADTLAMCAQLLDDPEDLMHKACGWMLREVGKRDEAALRAFLDEHGGNMPRTMLRYAIERLPEADRQAYLSAPSTKLRRRGKRARDDAPTAEPAEAAVVAVEAAVEVPAAQAAVVSARVNARLMRKVKGVKWRK